jgi:hypothetical protein
MSQFKYTLPSGAEYVVNGPSGATQAQADKIFYEQVASGSLVGYVSGQTLTSLATQITKFELSRLDRGTAGVETPTVLAIVQGLPTVSGLPNLSNVPLTNPINEGDIVDIKGDDLSPDSIGPLDSYQVQKLLAQTANLVDQESDQISQNKGIGRYGFTAYALEEAGYVKPGTSLRFFAVEPEDFVTVMSSPSVWTGRSGVYSLNDLLDDAVLQNRIQVQLMQQGYDSLSASGVIEQPVSSGVSISAGQVFTNGGLQSVRALTVAGLLGTNLGPLGGIAQNALTSSTSLNRLLNATNINLTTIGSGAVNNLTTGLGNISNLNFATLGTNLKNQVDAGIGSLVTNASKFGPQATELWAKASNLNFGTDLTKLAGARLTDLTGKFTTGLTGNLNNITAPLTNLIPGSLSNLTSGLDIFGKAGGFATNFANPLSNLNNLGNLSSLGNIGSLNTALTGQLGALQGQLTGALTGQLGALQGALTGQLGALQGALGGLGSFANIGAIGGLFGGGGDLVSGTAVAGGFNNTVNRATLDAAFARVVGSAKVPLPTFQYPSLAALAPRLDLQQAQTFLRNLQTPGTGGVFGQTVTI